MHFGAFACVYLRVCDPVIAASFASVLQSAARAVSQSVALGKPHVAEIWHSACAFAMQKLVTSG